MKVGPYDRISGGRYRRIKAREQSCHPYGWRRGAESERRDPQDVGRRLTSLDETEALGRLPFFVCVQKRTRLVRLSQGHMQRKSRAIGKAEGNKSSRSGTFSSSGRRNPVPNPSWAFLLMVSHSQISQIALQTSLRAPSKCRTTLNLVRSLADRRSPASIQKLYTTLRRVKRAPGRVYVHCISTMLQEVLHSLKQTDKVGRESLTADAPAMFVEQLTRPPAVGVCLCHGDDIARSKVKLFSGLCLVIVQRFDYIPLATSARGLRTGSRRQRTVKLDGHSTLAVLTRWSRRSRNYRRGSRRRLSRGTVGILRIARVALKIVVHRSMRLLLWRLMLLVRLLSIAVALEQTGHLAALNSCIRSARTACHPA
jgi:hypothetical protein